MANKLTYSEIIDRANYYREDVGLRELHQAAKNYWYPLFNMSHVPSLPQFFTKGAQMAMNAPDLMTFSQGLLADFDSYQSITNVAAKAETGSPTQAMKDQADKIERFAAVLRSDLSDDGALQRGRLWLMGFSAYAVNILRCTDDGWAVDQPAFDSCYFPVTTIKARPAIMIRDYEMLATKAVNLYTDDLEEKKPGKVNGKWDWVPLSYETPTQYPQSPNHTGGSSKFAEMVRVIWLDDGENIYHVLMNSSASDDPKGEKGGQVVYDTPNLTGGCSGLYVAGASTEMTETIDRIGPCHLPLMQDVLNLNLLTAMEATMMIQARPDLAVEYSPEQIVAATQAGILVPLGEKAVAQNIEVESDGGQSVLHFGGKPIPLAFAPSESRKMLMEQWVNTRDRYYAEWRQPTDQGTVGDARANVYLSATEAIYRRQTTQLKLSDWADTTLVNMALHTIVEREERRKSNEPGYEDDVARQKTYTRHARGGETGGYGELSAGQGVSLTAADLIDFDFDLHIATKAETESDRRARIANGMQEVAWNITAEYQVVEKAYIDATAQYKILAKDLGRRQLRPIATSTLWPIFCHFMLEKYGIDMSAINPGPVPSSAAPAGAGTGPSPMPAPSIPGPGSSGPPQ